MITDHLAAMCAPRQRICLTRAYIEVMCTIYVILRLRIEI